MFLFIMSYEVRRFFNICWGKPHNFLVLNNSSDVNNEKYRYNFLFLEHGHKTFEAKCKQNHFK